MLRFIPIDGSVFLRDINDVLAGLIGKNVPIPLPFAQTEGVAVVEVGIRVARNGVAFDIADLSHARAVRNEHGEIVVVGRRHGDTAEAVHRNGAFFGIRAQNTAVVELRAGHLQHDNFAVVVGLRIFKPHFGNEIVSEIAVASRRPAVAVVVVAQQRRVFDERKGSQAVHDVALYLEHVVADADVFIDEAAV